MNFFFKNKAIIIEIIVALFIGFIILKGNITEPVFKLSETNTNTDMAEENINVAIEAEPSDSIATLIAVGDIMLSRDVDTKIQKYQDYTYPFLKTADLLKSSDITFGNLESPITPGRKINTNEMVFRADPEVVEGLNLAGFDILSLANNHSLNFGKEGLNDTFEYLEESGIKYTGAGKSISTSYLPVITEAQNITFAFLAYS
ncbi:MAG: CapA family protein, partial [Patescibacteria group bacterium]